jgi:YVTN family beta-propeller protein
LTTTIPDVMPVGVFSPDAQHLYGVGLGGVAVISTATNAATTAIANLPGAGDLAITPDGRHLYITDGSTNSVVIADTSTNMISTTIGGVNAPGAIAIVPAPSIFPPLRAFKVSKLHIHVDDRFFDLRSELLLDVSSSGVGPDKQPIRLQVGPFITTIPAGSFFKHGHDDYRFEGDIDGVHLSVTIKQIGASRYDFDATARGVSLTGVTNPVQVSLNINGQGGILTDVAFIDPKRHHGGRDDQD